MQSAVASLLLLALPCCGAPYVIPAEFAKPGGVTCGMWRNADDLKGRKVTAALLTPVTLSLDAALLAAAILSAGYSSVDRGEQNGQSDRRGW